MMKKSLFFILLAGISLALASISLPEEAAIDENTPVWQVLEQFGEARPNHDPDKNMTGASAERGRDLVLNGITSKPKGGKTRKQSAHFVCTSCHNVKKEIKDLSSNDPQERLEYAKANGLPFLQGSSLYGAVNRTSFYNEDYEKKYGDLVKPTRNNLREAIQLCAVECSQGRRLKDWELESVLQYLWTLELKMGDLSLGEADYQKIRKAAEQKQAGANKEMIDFIKKQYRQDSPAHFVTPPKDRTVGYSEVVGNPENGKLLFELSCLHCHEKKRYSFYALDNSQATFRYLKKHFARYSRYSVYQVARYGTSPMPGKRSYMPQYTMEKMSNQQLEDLRAYIEQQAK